jgi:outer membrane receptor for ferric coprogen and ferric-rhodotorulic acid
MNLSVNAEDIPTTNLVGDVYLSTPFTLFGQQHNFLIGADYADTSQTTWRAGAGALPQINIFAFDPGAIPEPTFNVLFSNLQAKTRNYGTYGQLRLKPIEDVTVIAGGRFSWRELNDHNRINNTRTSGPDVSAQFTPYLAAIYDITETISLYASDTQIFQAQSATTVAGTLLPPIIGRQYEVGLKAEFFDGILNASTAIFQTTRSNEALPDALNPGFSLPGGKRRVEGFEAEVTGRLLPGWDISAGYAFNEAKILTAAAGAVITSFPSKHAFNLWTNYAFSEGMVSGLEVGGGLRVHSSFFTRSGAVRFNADGYTVAALRLGYTISDNIKAAVNIENLLDETYYAKAGNATANNYFGTPRSIMFTVRAAY